MHRLAFRWLLALALALAQPLLGLAMQEAAAAPLRLVAQGNCPSEEQVREQLATTLPGMGLDGGPESVEVRWIDVGDAYSVVLPGARRRFLDPNRNCEARAQAAAVLIAMLLAPPTLFSEQPRAAAGNTATTAAGPEPATPAPAAAVPVVAVLTKTSAPLRSSPWGRPLHVYAEASGVFSMAASSIDALAGGGELRVGLGSDWLSILFGGAVLGPASPAMGQANMLRASLDLDVRAALRRGRIHLALDLGFFAGLMEVSGVGFTQNLSTSRGDGGLRLAPAVHVGLHPRVDLRFALPLSVSFKTYSLVSDPEGLVADTPRLWLSATAGLVVRTR